MSISLTAAAQDLTLSQAVNESLDRSPDLQRFSALERESHWRKVESYSGVLPKFSLFADHYFTSQYETVPVSLGDLSTNLALPYPLTTYGVEANWVIFDGFANWNKLAAADLRQQASHSEYNRKSFETRKSVELSYFSVLAAVDMSEVAKRNLKTVEESLTLARFRLQNGASIGPDVLRVEVRQTEAQAEVERTSDNIVINRDKLRQVMGLENDERDLIGEYPNPHIMISSRP